MALIAFAISLEFNQDLFSLMMCTAFALFEESKERKERLVSQKRKGCRVPMYCALKSENT